MPTYKLKLEVEVTCPEKTRSPELTITPREIMENILTKKGFNGYAVTVRDNPKKWTADMRITKAEFIPPVCKHCGLPMPRKLESGDKC